MAQVEIRDHALWIGHIVQDPTLQDLLSRMPAGAVVDLRIDGRPGVWRKMDDGRDGRPTPGLRPIAAARIHWHELQARRGERVELTLVDP